MHKLNLVVRRKFQIIRGVVFLNSLFEKNSTGGMQRRKSSLEMGSNYIMWGLTKCNFTH